MARLFQAGKGGILADEMGLGKTVQVCTLLGGLRRAAASHVLILMPVTLMDQWRREIKTWCPDWHAFTYYGTPAQRSRALSEVMRPQGGILLTSYSLFSNNHAQLCKVHEAEPVEDLDCEASPAKKRRARAGEAAAGARGALRANGRERPWDLVICDEAHNMKNISTVLGKCVRHIRATCRLLLTGTPVQNALQDLWALVDFAQPGLLGNHATFTKHFSEPINQGSVRNASSYAVGLKKHLSEQLWQLVSPHVLRRTKLRVGLLAGDEMAADEVDKLEVGRAVPVPGPISDADGCEKRLKVLPPKLEIIVWLMPTKEQICVYKAILEKSEVIRQAAAKTRLGLDVFRAIGLLKRLCNHPALTMPASAGDNWPALLREATGMELSEARTGHELEGAAGEREDMDVGDSCASLEAERILQELPRTGEGLLSQSAKLRCLKVMLPALVSRGHRVLVFSQGIRMLDLLEACIMKQAGLGYSRIDGQTNMAARAQRVREFQERPPHLHCMLLTTSVGGFGLNLTAADRVIMLDPAWNPAIDAQAVDRVFRIGQTREVRVYRLVMSGLMEDKMFRLQVFKLGLMRETLDAKDQHHYFTSKEIRSLFDWTDPAEGETRKVLVEAHSQDQEDTVLARARDDGADEGWREAGPVIGFSNFSVLFSQQSAKGRTTEPDQVESVQAAEMKAKLVSAQEKLRETTEAKQNSEQQSSATTGSFEEATQSIAAAQAARARAENRFKDKSMDLKKIRRLEVKAKEGLSAASARRAEAQEAHTRAQSSRAQAEKLAASASSVAQASRTALLEAEKAFPDAIAGVEGVLALLEGAAKPGTVSTAAIRGNFKAACAALDAAEAAHMQLETMENELLQVDAKVEEARAAIASVGSRGASAAAEPASSGLEDTLRRREAEQAAVEAEHARTKQRVEDVEERTSQAMSTLVEAGLAFAEELQALKVRSKALEAARQSAAASFRQFSAAWQAARRLREPWRRALGLRRRPAREALLEAAASAAACRRAAEEEKEHAAAEAEVRARQAKREACEVEVEAARALRDAAEADEAMWRRRRDELRVALGSTYLALLRSSAAVQGAASEQEALRAWCTRNDNLQMRMESNATSAVEVLRAEQYNAKQVEEAYQAKKKPKWGTTQNAFRASR